MDALTVVKLTRVELTVFNLPVMALTVVDFTVAELVATGLAVAALIEVVLRLGVQSMVDWSEEMRLLEGFESLLGIETSLGSELGTENGLSTALTGNVDTSGSSGTCVTNKTTEFS